MNAIQGLEEEIRRAIEAARRACVEPRWNGWAEGWLSSRDRSATSANQAARDARVASGRPNTEDLDDHRELASKARASAGYHSGLYLDLAEMERARVRCTVAEPAAADGEAERIKLAMTAAELAAHAAALAAGAMTSSEFVAERIGDLALDHARQAQRLVESF